MNFYAWVALINTLTTGFVAIFVWFRRQQDPRRITFAFFSGSVASWSFFYFLWQLSTTENAALIFCRLLIGGSILIPVTYLHHVTTLVAVVGLRRPYRFIQVGYLAALILLACNCTSLVVAGVVPRLSFAFWPLPGPVWLVYMLWFFVYVIYATHLLYKGYCAARGPLKKQLLQLLIGYIIAFGGGSTNFFLAYGIPVYPIGNVVVPLYAIWTAMAVVRYRFMDIRVAITETGLLLGTYLVVLGIPFVVGWWGGRGLERAIGREWWLVPLGLCTALATAGPFVFASLRRKAEAKFLSDQRRYQRTLQLAARGMTRVRNLALLSHLITRLVSRTVRVTHASLFLWDTGRERYVLRSSHGPKRLSLNSRYELEKSHPLIQDLERRRKTIVGYEPSADVDPLVHQELEFLGAAVVIPGLIEHHLIGFLVLGQKRSGAWYLDDDLHAFATLANEAAMAIENAGSYEELYKVTEQLKAASARMLIQEKMASAGQFATGMAHEIKNPLSAIKTFAQYLPEKYADPVFRKKFFRIVQAEIDRINGIVQELSDFAKPAPLQPQPVRLAELVDDTLHLLSGQCLKQGIDIHKSFNENGFLIQADPQQIKQVLLNLILNSLEAMENGGRLDVSTSSDDRGVRLTIKDTGTGVEPKHLNQIWDPFFTTKERGTGLGLPIVKGVVERHGGHIHLSSFPGKGTTVDIILPARTA